MRERVMGEVGRERSGCPRGRFPLLIGLCFAFVLGFLMFRAPQPVPFAREQDTHRECPLAKGRSNLVTHNIVRNIAFGSCISPYPTDAQPVWDQVVASEPDLWIWGGDMSYSDMPLVRCSLPQYASSPQCNCTNTGLIHCMAGNLTNSKEKWRVQLQNADYNKFLKYMCPKYDRWDLAAEGHGPPGIDSSVCQRPILGIWDDHDSGYDNRDKFMPGEKAQQLQDLFLNAIGEPPSSCRRLSKRGMWWSYMLNSHLPPSSRIEVVLLDLRTFKDPMPCHNWRAFCKRQLETGDPFKNIQCLRLYGNGKDHPGLCCTMDERIYMQKCKKGSKGHMCNPADPAFGQSSAPNSNGQSSAVKMRDIMAQTHLCEVLGAEQRQWLRDVLNQRSAAVRLIVVPQPLFGKRPLHAPESVAQCGGGIRGINCTCTGDDMDCYLAAQHELIYLFANAPGCNIVLTGDYHFSEIKVALPGDTHKYSSIYHTNELRYPLYQIMASGMTAELSNSKKCRWSASADVLGMRVGPGGEKLKCVDRPAFGTVLLHYAQHNATGAAEEIVAVVLQIKDALTGEVLTDTRINVNSQCPPLW